MSLSGIRRAGLQAWEKSKKPELLVSIPISAKGPVLVPQPNCMIGETLEPHKKAGNSPPTITITAVKPGTSIPRNTNTVEISWEIEHADELWAGYFHPSCEVREPNTFIDMGGWENSETVTPATYTFTYSPGATLNLVLFARNADGEVYQSEMIFYAARVGYHDARCPAGGSIDTDEMADVRAELEEVEGLLRADALHDLPTFVEEWNRDAPPGYQFGSFDLGMDYLSGRVGTGSLADDILSAMQEVLIHIKPDTLPRGHRPGTTTGTDRPDACSEYVVGRTYYSFDHPDCNYLLVCRNNGADALTLLHELYHYATGMGDSDGAAVAVSCCAFDYIPF